MLHNLPPCLFSWSLKWTFNRQQTQKNGGKKHLYCKQLWYYTLCKKCIKDIFLTCFCNQKEWDHSKQKIMYCPQRLHHLSGRLQNVSSFHFTQTSGNTLGRLGRGKEKNGAIKRAGDRLAKEKEFLSLQNVPLPRSNGLTEVLMSLLQNW